MDTSRCRFNDVFARDEQGLPRNWSPSANIPLIAQQARQSAARLLAMLAVIRLHATKVHSCACGSSGRCNSSDTVSCVPSCCVSHVVIIA